MGKLSRKQLFWGVGIPLCKYFRYVSPQRVWAFEQFWSEHGYKFRPLWSQSSTERERTSAH